MQLRRSIFWMMAFGLTLGCTCQEEAGSEESTSDEHEHVERVNGLTREEASAELVKIGDRVITVGEFAAEIAEKGPYLRARYNTPERRRELLEQMIRFELLAQEALRLGYDRKPEVQRARNQLLIRRFLEQRFDGEHRPTITDEEIAAFYESHISEYRQPEQVRAMHILIKQRPLAERILAEVRADPRNAARFRQLAEQHNQDPATRDRFGDLRFFSRPEERTPNEPEVPEAVAQAAFSISEVGGIAPELVRSEAGFHIVKLVGRRNALDRSLADAQGPIRERLVRERREEAIRALVEDLKSSANIEEHPEALSEVHIDVPEGTFPSNNALPTGIDAEYVLPTAPSPSERPGPTEP